MTVTIKHAKTTNDLDFVNNLDIIHYRVKYNNNIITKLPLESMNYKYHGECIYLNYYGVICKLIH